QRPQRAGEHVLAGDAGGHSHAALPGGPRQGRPLKQGAAQLVAYFKSHIRKVYAALDADPRIAEARKVLRCLERNPGLTPVFTRRDLYQHLRRSFKQPEALDAPLRLLTEYGYIQPELPERVGPGRQAPGRYHVNPIWIEQTRTRCTRNPRNSAAEGDS